MQIESRVKHILIKKYLASMKNVEQLLVIKCGKVQGRHKCNTNSPGKC